MDEQTDGELRALIQAPRGSREATELLSALERESVHAEVSESASHSAELFAREPYDFYFVGESQAEEIDLGVAERPSVTLVLVGDICLPSLVRLTDPGRSHVLARTRVLPFCPNSNSRSISVGPLLAEKRDDYRRRAEQSIYRDMLRNTDSVVIRLDLEGRITFANQAIQSVLGVDMGEAVGADAFATVLKLPEEREDILRNVSSNAGRTVRRETTWNRTAGEPLRMEWRIKAMTDSGGRTNGVLCIGDRTTGGRYARERYRVLFEESKDMIYACTPEGVLTDINPAGVELLRCSSRADLLGRNIVEFYASSQDRTYYDQQIRRNGYVKDFELVLRRSDGSDLFVLETSSAIRNAEGEIAELRGIVKDITERINAEKTQMQMNIKLTDANRKLKLTQSRLVQQEKLASIGQLAAGVAHEINNPLGFVKSNYGSLKNYVDELYSYVAEIEAELMSKAPSEGEALIRLRREVNQLDFIVEDIQSIFEESDQGFERIIAIVRGLRNFSRKDARGEKAEYDLNAALDDALVMARNELKYVADVTKDYGRIPKVECHVDEINQVLLNVIINAAQAIKAGEYGEKRNVTVRTRSGHNEVVCEISDEGTGIPGDLADKIFDPFFTTKEIGKGTGLGLSISYDIVVNRHGGELSVTSTPGKGSTFTIKLPVRRDTT